MNGRGHAGQAAAEAVLALGVIGLVWVLGAAVGRLQDLALQTGFASRHLAFAVAQDVSPQERARAQDYFFGAGLHHWRNHDGSALLRPETGGPRLRVARGPGLLSGQAQVGGPGGVAEALRTELLPAYQDIVSGDVSVTPRLASGLAPWLATSPALSSRFAILADAGHARDDRDAQARIGNAPSAWGTAAQATVHAGRGVSSLGRIDAGWRRPLPQFDWLSAWAGLVPADRLREAP
ncbi:hypothetical protein CDO44_26440 [Pigmentiphaga sp. NML080357]|uniref:hypothetical protein n=1 Tax=Pigmentiphaga sp. NML080357 TaxID=2008675 RepID=UPI000B41452E|nr:hypothetical protein [Pigmentiphaga sp. NML080357]OVZ54291.1 hypothetical protein CDO44_26440 [Pigmentiphaga sp. NML080357]